MDKTVIVTGASRGLGLVVAKTLLENGYSVIAINRSHSDKMKVLLDNNPETFKIILFDLSDVESIPILFKQHIGLSTPIYGYINNAAMAYDDIITNLNPKKLREMYNLNVFSPMNMTKYVIRQMLLHCIKGSIIHISSISVHTGYKGLSMYASTKGALEAFSKNTAREWGKKGIRSNCIVAGYMQTSMSASLSEEQLDKIIRRTALKKITEKESVAKTIEFLLSNKSSSISGQNIFVDSGTI